MACTFLFGYCRYWYPALYFDLSISNKKNSTFKYISRAHVNWCGLYAVRFSGFRCRPYDKEIPLAFSNDNGFPPTEVLFDNPAASGDFSINTFTYGSGTDEQRAEFSRGVKYKTNTVDGTWLIPDWIGK